MKPSEAYDWLYGNRSMANLIPQDPFETWQVRISQADAAMTQTAYYVLLAHKEKFIVEVQE